VAAHDQKFGFTQLAFSARRPLDLDQVANPLQKGVGRKRLLKEVVRSGFLQFGHLGGFDHSRDAEDLYRIQASIASNVLAHQFAVQIGQHHVQHNDVGAEFLHLHPCIKTVIGRAQFKPAVPLECIRHQIDQVLVVVDDQQLLLAAFQGIRRDTVFFHEVVEMVARDSAEPTPWNPKPLERPVVKATNDRLLTYLADLGRFPSREHRLQ